MPYPALALAAVVALAAAAPAALAADEPAAADNAYAVFNQFCRDSFGAQKEPLVYERFGDTLAIADDSSFLHAGVTSAAIAWTTTLPASTVVEFGETAALGQTTAPAERPFYNHLHHLTGLKPATTYHYRLVCTDERGNVTASQPATFRTAAASDFKSIDAIPPGGFRITSPGRYRVTTDLAADHAAILIEASDVTLDLDGHTVTYDVNPGEAISGEDPNAWFEKSPHGVALLKRNLQNVRVLNGTIVQGRGGSGAQANGRGANPVGAMSGCTGEIAGLTVRWHGPQVHGVLLLWGPPIEVHHNVLEDHGTGITNRHQGVTAVQGAPKPHHNRVSRTRHRGIDCTDNADLFANEVYIDSMATNATGLFAYKNKNVTMRDNRVFGGGYLAVGIGALSQGTQDVKITGNLVHVQAAAPSANWAEYGEQSGAYCFRVTWGGERITAEDNLFVSVGRDGGMVRGVWYCPDPQQKGNVIRRNTIKAISENDATDVRGAVVISGSEDPAGVVPVLIEDNRIISNFCNVLLGEPYGSGHSTRFVGNTFERVGELDRYRFVQIGHGNQQCVNNRFVDSVFGTGASPDQVRWEGHDAAPRTFELAATLTVRTRPGTPVTVTSAAGDTLAQGEADGEGRFEAAVTYATFHNGQRTDAGTLTVKAGGASKLVTLEGPVSVELGL